jgi:predicted site-specific integrase-resolvase
VTILEIIPKRKKAPKNIESQKDQRLKVILKNLSSAQKRDLINKVKRILKNGMSLRG